MTLYEREAIAAGASGRNSGVLQHPMDPALVPLYEASLELYAGLGHGFELPAEPAGLLVVARDPAALTGDFEAAPAQFPALAPEWLEGAALQAAEPSLAGRSVRLPARRPAARSRRPPPRARGPSGRARRAPAIVEGEAAVLARRDGRVEGVRAGGRLEPAGAVVVAAGPWTPAAIGAGRRGGR